MVLNLGANIPANTVCQSGYRMLISHSANTGYFETD